jgi:hypothetical protein
LGAELEDEEIGNEKLIEENLREEKILGELSGMNDEKGIVIEKVIDASRDAVWRAWTEPKLIKKW